MRNEKAQITTNKRLFKHIASYSVNVILKHICDKNISNYSMMHSKFPMEQTILSREK